MRNLTISVDEELLRWARVRAAERDISVSQLVSDMLREKQRLDLEYAAAMNAFLSLPPLALDAERLPTRDELYDRPVFRRY